MALTASQPNEVISVTDNTSDYGSDIDDETAFDILSQVESRKPSILASIEEVPLPAEHESLEQRIHLRLSRLQQSLDSVRESSSKIESIISTRQVREASVEVEYDEGNRGSFSPIRQDESQTTAQQPALNTQDVKNDTRSMLERFRTNPKKTLSVTDLITPAWCEQQYEYSLTKHGRVRATPAMKQGSKVHKKLEEQVHKVVPVETVSKEDGFGLRLWNTIEGLRSLRDEGLTRELEVWGVIDGEVVIGIIDEISTICPDEQMEATLLEALQNPPQKDGKARKKSEQLAPDQRTLKDFLTGSQSGSLLENNSAFLGTLQSSQPRTYYLKDIKTRQSRTLPAPGASSRPTHMQLMLYHRLLTALASNTVEADTIFIRYGLDPHAQFSDKFIAEIANLNMPPSQTNDPEGSQAEDPLTVLLAHNTLTSLWSLMISELQTTFFPSRTPAASGNISPLLTAEFRTGSARKNRGGEETEQAGALLGQRCFPFEAAVIDAYVTSEMAWWKGQRPTVGVEVEEAFKCRICEFSEVCTWRATKVEEGVERARLRREGLGGRSAV